MRSDCFLTFRKRLPSSRKWKVSRGKKTAKSIQQRFAASSPSLSLDLQRIIYLFTIVSCFLLPSCVCCCTAPSFPPRNLHVYPLTSRSLQVTWKHSTTAAAILNENSILLEDASSSSSSRNPESVLQQQQQQVIKGYYLGYRQISSKGAQQLSGSSRDRSRR